MTQEYEFFKDFAGVTKADLEMFKCGGKKKKMQNGNVLPNIKNNKDKLNVKPRRVNPENERPNPTLKDPSLKVQPDGRIGGGNKAEKLPGIAKPNTNIPLSKNKMKGNLYDKLRGKKPSAPNFTPSKKDPTNDHINGYGKYKPTGSRKNDRYL